LPPGLVEVSETRAGRYVQTMRAGRHLLVADEPVTVDGNDMGPGPYEQHAFKRKCRLRLAMPAWSLADTLGRMKKRQLYP
jgi:hypothetical protein